MRIVCLTQRAGWARRTGVCLALAILCTQAYADPALRHFDIQSQVASLALKEFARQADISLVFSSTVVAHHQTAGLRGDFIRERAVVTSTSSTKVILGTQSPTAKAFNCSTIRRSSFRAAPW